MLISAAPPASAEWSATGGGALFWTDNANLFSATRRSSLDGDPSQPVLETSTFGHGKDMVFEPNLRVMKFIPNSWGQTAFTIKARGFVYAVNPEFSQAGIYLEGVHAFNPNTALRLRFFTAPDQLLGQANVEPGGFGLQDARVTSHIGAVRFDKRLSEHFEIQLYGRAGIRRFNEPFAARDTLLWTIGPHFVWHMTHHARMVLGYHYERGYAEGLISPEFQTDASYVHHFASVALEMDLMEHLELELDFHYERNNFTSGFPEDELFHGHENIFLGSGRLLYQVTDNTALTLTVQRANRVLSSEHVNAALHHNTNVGLGVLYRF